MFSLNSSTYIFDRFLTAFDLFSGVRFPFGVHVLLSVVGTEAFNLLAMAAAVEQPAATGDEG